jgi:SAM-dependent methyltransferase
MEREDWNRRHLDPDVMAWAARPNRILVGELAGLAPGRALDLACGAGRNAVWLAEQGWQVTGVDFSDVALEGARRRAAELGVEVDWVEADLRDYEPARAAFDLVLVVFLQLPADERRLVLARAAAALAPGGTLLVLGHDSRNLTEGWGGPRDPAVLYTPEDLVAELPGLEIERAESVLRPVETDGGTVNAVDALLRARRP